VDKLSEKLPNLLGKFQVPLKSFNHLDFLWAIDVESLVYDKVIGFIESY
jgi:hypothetical protein